MVVGERWLGKGEVRVRVRVRVRLRVRLKVRLRVRLKVMLRLRLRLRLTLRSGAAASTWLCTESSVVRVRARVS